MRSTPRTTTGCIGWESPKCSFKILRAILNASNAALNLKSCSRISACKTKDRSSKSIWFEFSDGSVTKLIAFLHVYSHSSAEISASTLRPRCLLMLAILKRLSEFWLTGISYGLAWARRTACLRTRSAPSMSFLQLLICPSVFISKKTRVGWLQLLLNFRKCCPYSSTCSAWSSRLLRISFWTILSHRDMNLASSCASRPFFKSSKELRRSKYFFLSAWHKLKGRGSFRPLSY